MLSSIKFPLTLVTPGAAPRTAQSEGRRRFSGAFKVGQSLEEFLETIIGLEWGHRWIILRIAPLFLGMILGM